MRNYFLNLFDMNLFNEENYETYIFLARLSSTSGQLFPCGYLLILNVACVFPNPGNHDLQVPVHVVIFLKARKHLWCLVYIEVSSRRYYRRCSLQLVRGRYGSDKPQENSVSAVRKWLEVDTKASEHPTEKVLLAGEIGVLDYLATQSAPDGMCFILDRIKTRRQIFCMPCHFLHIISFVTKLFVHRGIIRIKVSSRSRERNYISVAIFLVLRI